MKLSPQFCKLKPFLLTPLISRSDQKESAVKWAHYDRSMERSKVKAVVYGLSKKTQTHHREDQQRDRRKREYDRVQHPSQVSHIQTHKQTWTSYTFTPC